MRINKTRNTETGNGMRGTWGMRGSVVFWVMSLNIQGNVAKHSQECRQIFQEMSPNIPGNMSLNISRNLSNILRNISIFCCKGR